eukprot:CAMPEP_0204604544 /NCGR_PEP_ID=MMETSP0661-20131031/57939_1 /ASSEMBLY_ACC=CAM_ASM_000606 /TAXON_ID=109239 /ORGANISM="Alexandrium margalefi, Strain AMGDE01CS-322" /LENGTH=78 /DNA_ID=CAMNT_0051615717 /DNA_START=273 /DNA_END=509 /DNA_ORIENTATION=-
MIIFILPSSHLSGPMMASCSWALRSIVDVASPSSAEWSNAFSPVKATVNRTTAARLLPTARSHAHSISDGVSGSSNGL